MLGLPWLKIHDPQIQFAEHTVEFNSPYCQKNCNAPLQSARIKALHSIPIKNRPHLLPARPAGLEKRDIAAVSLPACAAYARRNYQMFAISAEDIEAALKPKTADPDPVTILPEEFRDFAEVFSPKEADRLPPHRSYDHDIKLKDDQNPPFGPLYLMSRDELKVLKE
jgi:hypothetical protein